MTARVNIKKIKRENPFFKDDQKEKRVVNRSKRQQQQHPGKWIDRCGIECAGPHKWKAFGGIVYIVVVGCYYSVCVFCIRAVMLTTGWTAVEGHQLMPEWNGQDGGVGVVVSRSMRFISLLDLFATLCIYIFQQQRHVT